MVSCRDWKPGMPLDLSRITPRDESYWKLYRATPRLFLNLGDAERIFANPFGNRTALCLAGSGSLPRLTPQDSGFVLADVRRTGLASAAEGTDFSGLFLGLSSVVVLAGLLLGSLTLGLSLRRRTGERETLRALGWPPRRIRAAVVVEVVAVVLPALIPGAALGVLYDALAVSWLNKIWASASAGAQLQARFSLASAAEAAAATLALFIVIAIWHARASARRTERGAPALRSVPVMLSVVAALAAATLSAAPVSVDRSIRWFLVGLLVLACGICVFWWFLSRAPRLDQGGGRPLLRWMSRRRGRCVGEAALLSAGIFLVLGIGGYGPRVEDPSDPHAGTGGFSWLLQTSLPVTAQEVLSLPGVVGVRVREGADASCLNLNRSKAPPVWGVEPGALCGRFGLDWTVLDTPLEDGSIPAVADMSVITWGLARRVGDSLDFVDESGKTVRLTLVAGIPDSIFQGALLVSEKSFKRLYPSESGYRRLLAARTDISVAERALRGRGLAVESTRQRLSRFLSVEATYLSIFVVLGGLGVALGSIGFALLCFRTLTEEARSIAILSALGWPPGRLLMASWGEHVVAWLWGAGAGTAAAATALVPQVGRVDWRSWAAVTLLIWASGAAALVLAAVVRPRRSGDLLRPE
jgi:putative ABC transport system permease protein